MNWIPCSERLPEEVGWLLVTLKRSEMNSVAKKFRVVETAYYIQPKGPWKTQIAHTIRPMKVMAWMPLPEPYKGDKK